MAVKSNTMRIILTTFLITIMTGISFGQEVKHVILISIDGFRPEFYKDSQWPAPNLHQMMAEGVYADSVRSVFPSVTYPSHTTIVTGAMPAKHGILHNKPFNQEGNAWYWHEEGIKVATLWDAAKKEGMTTASVYWPVTVGAPIDYLVPVIRPERGEKITTIGLARSVVNPAGLMEEIELNATGKLRAEIYNNNYFIMDENISRMATYLFEQYKPSLTAVHFISVDHVAHATGRNSNEVKKAVGLVDRAVGSIVETVKREGLLDSTAIIVTGDHGFADSHTRINPNIWLKEAGLINDAKNNEWDAIFEPTGGAAMLHLKDEKDKKTLKKIIKILDKLPENEKALFKIIDREALDRIGADPDVALALAGKNGVVFGATTSGKTIVPAKGGSHGYFPDFSDIHTGFIGWGAGFEKGKRISFMGLEDIAPIISDLLGISFDAPDGETPVELIDN